VAALPLASFPAAHAEPGLSKLTGLSALVERHGHLKYVVATGAMVVLIIVVILLWWRGDGGKAATSAAELERRSRAAAIAEETEPAPQDENTPSPNTEHKGRANPRGPSKRARSAGSSARAVAAVEDPFEGPPSRSPERPVPVASVQNSRARSATSGGEVKGISQAQISEVVRNRDNQAALRSCYERALKRDGRMRTGRLDITVSIGESGTVQRVQVNGPSDFLLIEGCLKNAIRHWRFPSNLEEYATSFPLILQGG